VLVSFPHSSALPFLVKQELLEATTRRASFLVNDIWRLCYHQLIGILSDVIPCSEQNSATIPKQQIFSPIGADCLWMATPDLQDLAQVLLACCSYVQH